MIVASIALFLSLGGVGYAASQLPPDSVGSAQLQFHAVTGNKIDLLSVGFRKIQLGAVGIRRINTNQVQARVSGTCGAASAIAAIDNQGNTQCVPTAPKAFATSAGPTTVGTTSTAIGTLSLPAGSTYMVYANPQVTASKTMGTSQVEVDCTLSITPGNGLTTQTRGVSLQANGTVPQTGTIALMLPAPTAPSGSSAGVACTSTSIGGAPTVSATTAINAIQTASNG